MKLAILYHSVSGNTKHIAEIIAEGMCTVSDALEVKIMPIDDYDPAYVKEATAVVFGTPTYYASMSWQMKKWFDTALCDLSGKLGSCFATANFMGGGSETAMSDLIHHMLVKGMVVYSSGGGSGMPFIHLGAGAIQDGDAFQQERAKIFGVRIAKKAVELFPAS